jgi:hypothetical protein
VVDADRRTVHVTDLRSAAIYAVVDSIPVTMFDGLRIPVEEIFAI